MTYVLLGVVVVVLGLFLLLCACLTWLFRAFRRGRGTMQHMIPAERWTQTLLDSYHGDARHARAHVIRLIAYHRAALARCEAAQFDLDTLLAPKDEAYLLYKR
jgi:hypothetical protein